MAKGFEWLDRTLVRSPYHIVLCTTEKGFKKVLKHIRLPESEHPTFIEEHVGACVHRFEAFDGSLLAAVSINKLDLTTEEIYGILCHEAVHVWQHVRDYIGESAPSIEFEAYSIQSISTSLMESYKHQTSPKKGKK